MIGWSTINPALLSLCTECALDKNRLAENFNAEWSDRPRSFINPEQKLALLLKVTGIDGIGEDETRYSEETVDDETVMTSSQTGQRKFTLQVQAIYPEQSDEQWWGAALERLRMRLRRPSVLQSLLDIDVSVIEIGRAIPVPFRDKGRVLSSGTMDIVFGCTANEDDPIPAGWIQYLVISSHVKDTDDVVLGSAQQMVNVEVPTIP